MKNIIVEGHRGFCARYPENTMPSFEAALELGVDAIEFDVWLTADKVPMLMHDGNAYRTCGVDKHLRDMTCEEAKEFALFIFRSWERFHSFKWVSICSSPYCFKTLSRNTDSTDTTSTVP